MKRSEIAISASLVPIDYLMVILAGIASYFFRYWEPIRNIRPIVFNLSFNFFTSWMWLIAVIWLVSFAIAGLYSMSSARRPIEEIGRIILGCSTAVMFLMFIFFFSRNLFDSRFIILAGWVFSIVFIIIGRGIVRFIQRRLYFVGVGVHQVVIIGGSDLSREVEDVIKHHPKTGYRLVGRFQSFDTKTEAELAQAAKVGRYDEILVASGHLDSKQLERLSDFSYVNHVTLKYVADIFDFPISNFNISTISGLPIVELKKTRLDGWGRINKRIFDIIVSAVLMIILSPVFLIAALAVKLSSRGPVFFSYQRIGQYGRPFRYFKFRSMIKDAHKYRFDQKFLKQQVDLRSGSPMMKFKDDPRVTPVGKFLRRFSIDELPELFNVFIGKMSLVGPRPHEVQEVEKYKNFHRRVLTIKPGITGMAQVSGRSDLDFDEEVRLDIWYMENWTMKLDILTLLRTPFAVLKKRKTE